jgi:hypothetical protein
MINLMKFFNGNAVEFNLQYLEFFGFVTILFAEISKF